MRTVMNLHNTHVLVEAALKKRFEEAIDSLEGIEDSEMERLLKIASSIITQIDQPMTIAALMFSIVEVAEAEVSRDITGYA